MLKRPLLISSVLGQAEHHHAAQTVVSRCVEGGIARHSYVQMAARARRLANALLALGVQATQRVATLAWNTHRHMELYYAVPGLGAVLHTLDPRMPPDHLAWVVNHARDQVLFVDLTFLHLVESVAALLLPVRCIVLMTDRQHMPRSSKIKGLLCYEDLLQTQDDQFVWPELDENMDAALCYTQGHAGKPQGMCYSHRCVVQHSVSAALPDALHLTARDCILTVVPMFQANAWCLPYTACAVGAKLVLPGAALDGASLYGLCEKEGVTVSAGVPAVWKGWLIHMDKNRLAFHRMRRTVVDRAVFPISTCHALESRYGVTVLQARSMEEAARHRACEGDQGNLLSA